MAKVVETRVKITLTDAMSGPLKVIQGGLDATSASASSLSASFKSFAAVGASMAAGFMGIYQAGDKLASLFSQGLDFSKAMETNSIGMAGILTSMTTINGEALKWNDALNISRGIIEGLNQDALETAATSEELVNTFRSLLGPGLGAGMSLDEIRKLATVGTNAVKSLGLNNVQIVQELRGLVQGGIRASSSTLATALGLTDADINAAKASSEGLFNFLMSRLEGFNKAAKATPDTLAGLQDQLQEGLTRGMAVGIEPIINAYKEALKDASGLVLTDNGLNEAFVGNIKAASEHAVNLWHNLEGVGAALAPIGGAALEGLGGALGLAADNAGLLIAAFAAYKAADYATDIYRTVTAADEAYQAQTRLGQAVERVGALYNSSRDKGLAAMRAEIAAAGQAANAVVQAERQKQAAARQTEAVASAANRLTAAGHTELAERLLAVKERYQELGATAEQAGRLQYQAAKYAVRGQAELAEAILNEQEQHMRAASAAKTHTESIGKWASRVATVAGAAAALSGAIAMATDSSDGFINSLANTGMAISGSIMAISMLIEQLGSLVEAYKAVSAAGTAAGLLKVGAVVGTAAAGIGLAVGGVTAGAYALATGLSFDDMVKRWTYSKEDWEREANPASKPASKPKGSQGNSPDLGLKFPKATEAASSGGGSSSARQLDQVKHEYEKNQRAINDLMAELDRKILENTGSQFEINSAKLSEELQKMQSQIDRAKVSGIDTSSVEAKMQEYASEQALTIKRQEVVDKHQLDMDYIAAREEADILTAQQADALRANELIAYKAHLQQMLTNQRLTDEQRLELEREYAEAVKGIREATSTDFGSAWEGLLDSIKNTQFNQLETMKSGWESITDTITSFGQNMFTEQKSFTERIKDLYRDLANNILNTMMKVAMQGMLQSIIGGIGGGSTGGIFGALFGMHAKGGIARGWSIVGEEGPELVNFENPGRVYTAEQTSAALGVGGLIPVPTNTTPSNIRVQIENRSSEKVEATSASASMDAEGMVINIVLDGIRTNKYGMQDAIKSLSGAY